MKFRLQLYVGLALATTTLLLMPNPVQAKPVITLPQTGLTAEELALIINDGDPLSRKIGAYYQKVRHIPDANVIHVRFSPNRHTLSIYDFQKLKIKIDQATPAHVQAYAVAWTNPYRVSCMSITSALAFGFSEQYCSSTYCGATKPSPYFNSASLSPAKDFKMRPAMLLAGTDFKQIKRLIDRGVASDRSFPDGSAYLVNTTDTGRNVRSTYFEQTAKGLDGVFRVKVVNADAITNRRDVLFYFTGLVQVPNLSTLRFFPGALADHLTSLGGQLTDSSQMSSLRWLEAGATASYGTVVEPCNHVQKFPYPGIAMFYYASGSTAIEAYWKSVAWPGEGVFIGEPLARPFAPKLRETEMGQYELKLFSAHDGELRVENAPSSIGPFNFLAQQPIHRGINVLRFAVPDTSSEFLRLQW